MPAFWYGSEDAVAERTVVIGGGQVGCETALHLAHMGRKVTIVEMCDRLAPDASPTHRTELMQELEKEQNIHILTDLRCEEIKLGLVECKKTDGQACSLQADTVILAAGMRSRSSEVDLFMESAPYVCPIGDCVRASTVEQA